MEAEHIQEAQRNVDAIFSADMPTEEMSADEAMKQIGTILIKAATDDSMTKDQVKGTMQYAYIMATNLHEWANDMSREHVSVPSPVAKAVAEQAEGDLQTVIPVSTALDLIAKKLAASEEPAAPEQVRTEKAAVAWGPDLASDAVADDSWGPDPAGLRS